MLYSRVELGVTSALQQPINVSSLNDTDSTPVHPIYPSQPGAFPPWSILETLREQASYGTAVPLNKRVAPQLNDLQASPSCAPEDNSTFNMGLTRTLFTIFEGQAPLLVRQASLFVLLLWMAVQASHDRAVHWHRYADFHQAAACVVVDFFLACLRVCVCDICRKLWLPVVNNYTQCLWQFQLQVSDVLPHNVGYRLQINGVEIINVPGKFIGCIRLPDCTM